MSSCPGCRKGLPTIPPRRLRELTVPGQRIRGRLCADALPEELWHLPREDLEALEELGKRHPAYTTPRPPTGRTTERPRDPGEPLEQEVVNDSIKLLRSLGWVCHIFEQGYRPTNCPHCLEELGRRNANTRVPVGTPDALLFGFGYSLWIEFKRPGGVVRPDQHEWHDDARQHGGGERIYIIRSVEAAWALHRHIIDHDELPPDGEFPPPEEE